MLDIRDAARIFGRSAVRHAFRFRISSASIDIISKVTARR